MAEVTEFINFKVTKTIKSKIKAQAFAESTDVSTIVRRAVDRYLDDHEPIRRRGLEEAIQSTTN